MTRQQIVKKVIEIVAEQMSMRKEEIAEETTYADIGADELDDIELTMQFEDEFEIDITDEDARKCRCVGDSINLVARLLPAIDTEVRKEESGLF